MQMSWGDPQFIASIQGPPGPMGPMGPPGPSINIVWGDVSLNPGEESIAARILRIEKCLGIVPRQRSLEEKYPDLKQLGDQIEQAIDEMQKYQTEMISRVVGAYKDFVKECEIMEKLSKDGANP